ncbi:HTH_Tnp_Tc3_2 domain-containing protein [Trichonephila clavipes]|uniref:HTH_Tnp_Tc3_2 domain-containing protein n=1 Tax=Trichonephila clavipes TaxID=2585209 RepID=A0A8X7BF91_TRICX|nr:HTH_Tnp_Tc3_2 domain-containing protein [Trichonephila clavipes]
MSSTSFVQVMPYNSTTSSYTSFESIFLPYHSLGHITPAHGSSIVITESSHSAAVFNPKTACGNRKNVARELTSAGNHQMARIVRHNDESVREGYIRNGGKEVKLSTIALKAFQCNNRIVMAQRKHLDDFLSGRIIERLECGRTQLEVSKELGIAQSVISRLWQRFQDDGNVSRCYSTGRPRVTTPNEDRYLAVTARRNRRSTASDLSRQLSSAAGTTTRNYSGFQK